VTDISIFPINPMNVIINSSTFSFNNGDVQNPNGTGMVGITSSLLGASDFYFRIEVKVEFLIRTNGQPENVFVQLLNDTEEIVGSRRDFVVDEIGGQERIDLFKMRNTVIISPEETYSFNANINAVTTGSTFSASTNARFEYTILSAQAQPFN